MTNSEDILFIFQRLRFTNWESFSISLIEPIIYTYFTTSSECFFASTYIASSAPLSTSQLVGRNFHTVSWFIKLITVFRGSSQPDKSRKSTSPSKAQPSKNVKSVAIKKGSNNYFTNYRLNILSFNGIRSSDSEPSLEIRFSIQLQLFFK